MKAKIIIIGFIFFVCSYSVCAEPSDSTSSCMSIFPIDMGGYASLIKTKIIRTQDEYDSLTSELREEHEWLNEDPPEIDFEDFMLIGDESWADCVASFSYDVKKDTLSKIVTLTIIKHYGGGRGMNVFEHWFLLPQLPPEYSIEIIHEKGEPKFHYED